MDADFVGEKEKTIIRITTDIAKLCNCLSEEISICKVYENLIPHIPWV